MIVRARSVAPSLVWRSQWTSDVCLSWNRYGKSRIRLVKVRRAPRARTSIVDLTLDVQLEGAFETVYIDGDNGPCLATDTMKNTVYAFARQDPIAHVEAFALRLADHFVGKPASRASASARSSIDGNGSPPAARPHPARVLQPGGEQWTAVVTRDRRGARRRVRPDEPRRAQDHRFGVLGISPRRVHDAAGHRGPDPGDVDHRVVDVPARARPISARASASAPRSSRRSRRTTAARCSTRSMPWARRRWRPAPTSARSR